MHLKNSSYYQEVCILRKEIAMIQKEKLEFQQELLSKHAIITELNRKMA